MCGIAGFLGESGPADDARRVAERMGEVLVHRGPDAGATWVDAEAGVALAHRRLSVIDLSSGAAQPMHSPGGRHVLSFNGEVYNHLALRGELEAAGERFATSSDTEVLLRALVVLGVEKALERVDGMFAFALWDRQRRELTLARDRFGEKPLYYATPRGHLLFGSELKALLQHPLCPREIDRDALAEYFRFQCIGAPRAILRGVHKLEPGSWLTVRRVDGALRTTGGRFWSPGEVAHAARATPLADREEAVDRLDALVREAVASRMIADVPLGAFLSGGIDSSLVVAAMQSRSTQPVKTFTIGFDDPRYDESAAARAVAAHLRTDHTELILTPRDVMDAIPRLPTIYDEPFADASQLPTLLVSRLARRRVTVVLSGDAGDELFAGYGHHARFARWAPRALAAPAFVRAASRAGSRLRHVRRGGWRLEGALWLLGWRDRVDLYERVVSGWHSVDALVPGASVRRSLAVSDWPELSNVELAMLHDTCRYLPDDILVKVDRASMAVALEARVPLLHPGIFELAWRMPIAWKVGPGGGKQILASVLERHVPRRLFDRPKTGFGVPIGDWLRGPLREWASDLLSPARLRAQAHLDAALVERTWKEHSSGARDNTLRVWTLLVFQAWLEAISAVDRGSAPPNATRGARIESHQPDGPNLAK
jgi:asparagine synthase (glutamine-hydrolysing)